MTCERCEFIETEYVRAEAEDLTRDALLLALAAARVERNRLRGLQPELPPRPPAGEGLPRYGLRWNGPTQPVAVPMDDGYWTPFHLAQSARCGSCLADLDSARAEGVRLRLLNERMLQCITGFVEAVEAAEVHATRPKGGQQVTFSGDFASAVPSVRGQLRWWARHLSQSTQEEL